MAYTNISCEHNTSNWASLVSQSGAIFHVCTSNKGTFLYPGAPAAGYNNVSSQMNTFMGTMPAGWLKLGW